jgi:DHA2 family multidrug resistance protein-like MFS transporter
MLSPALRPNPSSPTAPTTVRTVETAEANDANPVHDADGLPAPRRYAAIAAILGAGVLVVLDGAIANIALPSIARQLQAAPADAVWIITAYQLAVVMFLLPASAIGERFGYRRVFAGGVALFTAASVLCALAPSLPWLVAARCLQGLGSAAVMPLGLALLRFTYPRRLLARSIGWNALAVAAASAAGPTLGAFILSAASWPWLFAVNLPIGLLVLAACAGLPSPARSERPIDLWSIALNAAHVRLLRAGERLARGASVARRRAARVSAACMVLLVRRESAEGRAADPARPAARAFVSGLDRRVGVLLHRPDGGPCGAAVLHPARARPERGDHRPADDALAAGGDGGSAAVGAPGPAPAERLAVRGRRRVLRDRPGAVRAVAAARPPGMPIAVFTSLAGLGFGFFQTPNNQNMLLSAPKERSGAAGGAQGTARLTGLTLGSLLMSLDVRAAAVPRRCALGLGGGGCGGVGWGCGELAQKSGEGSRCVIGIGARAFFSTSALPMRLSAWRGHMSAVGPL